MDMKALCSQNIRRVRAGPKDLGEQLGEGVVGGPWP